MAKNQKSTAQEQAQQPIQGLATLDITSGAELQANFKRLADSHLARRFANNSEFHQKFINTFSDLVFSQDKNQLDILAKTNTNTLLNAIFAATEAGASFAKKEVYLIPFAEKEKKIDEKGVERVSATGKYDGTLIFDINFQRQQILKMPNCKDFKTREVREGVKVIEDLNTGNYIFEGDNLATKPTIGYYAFFITTEGEKYDLFMTVAEIIERAKANPHFKADNYKSASKNVHMEKLLIRNILKIIPKVSDELRSVMALDETSASGGFTDYVEIKDDERVSKSNRIEQAKKELNSPLNRAQAPINPDEDAFFAEAEVETVSHADEEEVKVEPKIEPKKATPKNASQKVDEELFF